MREPRNSREAARGAVMRRSGVRALASYSHSVGPSCLRVFRSRFSRLSRFCSRFPPASPKEQFMETTAAPPRTELLRRAEELVPLLQKHALWQEENRRLHDEAL